MMTEDELKTIARQVAAHVSLSTKEVLTADEAAAYMGVTKSALYKLTARGAIPYYKPTGKLCYFRRTELEQWLLHARVSSSDELDAQAAAYYSSRPSRTSGKSKSTTAPSRIIRKSI